MVEAGEVAPEIEAQDQHGEPFRLSDLRGQWVVLYFYPKDETTGCTREACAFRDTLSEFEELGAEVVGVSVQSVESHAAFAARHDLNFRLIADEAKEISRAYGTLGLLGVNKRVTFVIDTEGRVVDRYRSEMKPRSHVQHVKSVLTERRSAV